MKEIRIILFISFFLLTPLISFSLEPIDGGKRNPELVAQIKSESFQMNRMPASHTIDNCKDEQNCLESREVKPTSLNNE